MDVNAPGFWDAPPTDAAAPRLDAILAECARRDASDVHLAPGVAPCFRVDGELAPDGEAPPLSADDVADLARLLVRTSGAHGLAATGAQDGALTGLGGMRLRFNVFRRLGGVSIAIRRLEERFRTLADLGLPDALYAYCDLPDGIVLVAGPTGSGKSTTLAALVDRINRERRVHVVTIEDPIEYVHAPVRSLVNQRQVGSDASSFHDALVSALREDPDVILVGEVRDTDTIRTAIRAAETGHLVFTTVHAGDCVGTIERLVSVFPAEEQNGIRRQLSLVLRAVVAQHLLPAEGGARGDGGRGRVAASEILHCTPAVANLIASGRSAQIYAAMEGGGRAGMRTLEDDLARLVASGRVSEAMAASVARHPAILTERIALLRRVSAPGGGGR